MSEPSIGDYTVGWICALKEEYEAACRMLADEFDGPETSEANDDNNYVFGCVNGHNSHWMPARWPILAPALLLETLSDRFPT